jgi:hypothetical protein
MKTLDIKYNRYQWTGKIILFIVLLFIIALFVIRFPSIKDIGLMIFALGLLSFMSFIEIVFLFQFFFLPTGLKIDKLNQRLTIKFLFNKSKIIRLTDVKYYSSTFLWTKSTNYDGLFIHLNNNKYFLLSDYNLRDFKPSLTYFQQSGISFIGKEKYKVINYYGQFLR